MIDRIFLEQQQFHAAELTVMFWTLLRMVMVMLSCSVTVAAASTLSTEPLPKSRNKRICSHSPEVHGAFWWSASSNRLCRTVKTVIREMVSLCVTFSSTSPKFLIRSSQVKTYIQKHMAPRLPWPPKKRLVFERPVQRVLREEERKIPLHPIEECLPGGLVVLSWST